MKTFAIVLSKSNIARDLLGWEGMASEADNLQTRLSQAIQADRPTTQTTGLRNKNRHRIRPVVAKATTSTQCLDESQVTESEKNSDLQDEGAAIDTGTSGTEASSAPKQAKKKRLSLAAQATSAKLIRSLSGSQSPRPHLEYDMATPTPLRPISLLVASLGNPPPYHSTRHSAAHIVLQHLQSSLELPLFRQKSKPYGGGHISVGADIGRPEITLYQSAVLMNISGPPLLKAWRHFCGIQDAAGRTPGLVVLHDEMEIEPGRLKVRRAQHSIKGHNGLKSVQSSLLSAGPLGPEPNKYLKIGVGIGRPAGGSRQSEDVSAYVLGQLTSKEKEGLQQCTGELAMTLYRELEKMSKT